ncbi:glycosyltransferase family 4 protein [Thomasclavelia spiroformis]|uniref:glycosyltransferase family 4 protein n=1 Tax=Thomasclavelia spiroformis TaxID=29348 RepID=UPI000B38BB4E|nr:glycosyltransferase family 4 protein [Thomasclavelia spiroformis]OUO70301.1 hypothetical protein B5F64_06520 [Thomasclavelia spiroformis]
MDGNLLFLTGCYPKEMGNYFEINSKVMPQNAMNVLSWRIIEGLEANIPGRFTVVSCPFIGYYPKGFTKLKIKDFEWSHNQKDKDILLGFFNIKGLETLQKSERIFKYIQKWYKLSINNRHVLIYSHYAGFLRAAGKIKKNMPDMHITCIVTDMNELDERKDLIGLKGKIKGLPRAIMIKTTYKNLKYITSFVILADKMKEPLNIGNRPYVVVEGISDQNVIQVLDSNEFKKEKKFFRVVYTGTLHKRYGAIALAKAIESLKNTNIELYVCGSGDGEYDVAEISKRTSNIHYLGVLSHDKAIELQATADLLVNSMPNFGIHTALSFPSKTMEYMVMGKPVLCFKVDGIPDDYDDYLIYFEKFEIKSMASTILKISTWDSRYLKEIGVKNRQYVLKNKTPSIQIKKILHMLEND